MKLVITIFLFWTSAYADCFDDDCLSPPKVVLESPFYSIGKIKISCAEVSNFDHMFVAMSYEIKDKSGEVFKGRTIDWIGDVSCADYKKVWVDGPNLFFRYEFSGDNYNVFESPQTCHRRFEWNSQQKKFLDKNSKCLLSEWEIKNKKAEKIFQRIIKRIAKGDFKALKKLSPKDVQFLQERFKISTFNFRASYENENAVAGLRYLKSNQSLRAHFEFLEMIEQTKKWFDDHCPDVEVAACKIDFNEQQSDHDRLIQDMQSRLFKPKYALDWIYKISKFNDDDWPILELYQNDFFDRVDEILDGLPAKKQVTARLKLVDLIENTSGFSNDKSIFREKYLIAAAEADLCQKVPVRMLTDFQLTDDREFYQDLELNLQGYLASKEKPESISTLAAMVAIRIDQKNCHLIPRKYYLQLKQLSSAID